MTTWFPRARTDDVLQEVWLGETLLTDARHGRAHALRPLAARVYALADGTRSVEAIAREVAARADLGLSPGDDPHELVELALTELSDRDLLTGPRPPRIVSRRDLLRRAGAGAGMGLILSLSLASAGCGTDDQIVYILGQTGPTGPGGGSGPIGSTGPTGSSGFPGSDGSDGNDGRDRQLRRDRPHGLGRDDGSHGRHRGDRQPGRDRAHRTRGRRRRDGRDGCNRLNRRHGTRPVPPAPDPPRSALVPPAP